MFIIMYMYRIERMLKFFISAAKTKKTFRRDETKRREKKRPEKKSNEKR